MIINYAAFLYILEEVSISEYNPTHFLGTFHEVKVVILDSFFSRSKHSRHDRPVKWSSPHRLRKVRRLASKQFPPKIS